MIILIGGCACVGKTTAAVALAKVFKAPHLRIDDGFEEDISPFRGPSPWQLSTEKLSRRLVEKSQALHSNLLRLIGESGATAVIEGEGIAPNLIDESLPRPVRLVLIVESDGAAIGRNMAAKSSTFCELSPARKTKVVAMCSAYNEWIRREAMARNLPLVSSRPWSSLVTRVLEGLHGQTMAG